MQIDSHIPEKDSPALRVLIYSAVIAALSTFVGWNVRWNAVLEEMKQDPIGWVSRLPLDQQTAIKEYLKKLPEGLQTSHPAE